MIQISVGNIMLMTFPLTRIEPILSFSRYIRKYVSLKILRSIYFAVLTPDYPTAVLSGLRSVALFSEL